MNSPYISFIIPVFNRERIVGRAIDSILRQDFDDREIIVVDDGSTDGSLAVLHTYEPKVRVLAHAQNQGVLQTRMTGVQAARGEWIIFLDSDDELAPDVLRTIHHDLSNLAADIKGALFLALDDTGRMSPDPIPDVETFDYISYLRFIEQHVGRPHDFLNCARRMTFETVYPRTKGVEELYLFDFYSQFATRIFFKVALHYHQDAGNQLSQQVQWRATDRVFAKDRATMFDRMMAEHGPALSRYAPEFYEKRLSTAAAMHFMAGNRGKGVKYGLRALGRSPRSLRHWTVVITGLCGSRVIRWARARSATPRL